MDTPIEETLYFKNIVDGIEMPPYLMIVHRAQGVLTEVPKKHTDENGAVHSIRKISKQEFDSYWEKEKAIQDGNTKKAETEAKKLNKKISSLRESSIKKLVAGEKLSEEEANFVAGNLGV